MNWPDLIATIQTAGLSQPQIAKECGCAQSTISDLAAGKTKEPRYSIGVALERLAMRHKPELASVALANCAQFSNQPSP